MCRTKRQPDNNTRAHRLRVEGAERLRGCWTVRLRPWICTFGGDGGVRRATLRAYLVIPVLFMVVSVVKLAPCR